MVGLTTPVCDRATIIRATYRFRLGDALNLAAAVVQGWDHLVTNDTRLRAFQDIPVDELP